MLHHQHEQPETLPSRPVAAPPDAQQTVTPPETLPAVAPVVQRTSRRRRRHSAIHEWRLQNKAWREAQRLSRVIWIFFAAFTAFSLLKLPVRHLFHMYGDAPEVLMNLAAFVAIMAYEAARYFAKEKRKAAVNPTPLPEQESIHDIGDLIDRLIIPNHDYVKQINERLIRLLPQLTPDNADLLAPRHYEYLNARLHQSSYGNWRLTDMGRGMLLAVLEAYSQAGDVRALLDVRRLAAGKAVLYSEDKVVIAAAQRCLVALQQLAAQQTQANTLLRGSEPPVEPDTLLRPASGIAPHDTGQLLRPAAEEDSLP